jgi:hypothetical protein
VGNQAARHHHDTRRIFIKPVNNARPRQIFHFWRVVQQCVNQRTVGVTSRGMHHQAGGLVDNQQVLVLKHNIQVDCLWLPTDLRLRFSVQRQSVPQHHFVTGLAGFPVYCERP